MKTVKIQHDRVAAIVGGELLDSVWVRRLARISFLGTLDHHPRSRKASSRYEHSLAVASLSVDVATHLQLDRKKTRTLVCACLLHDVGHYPFSHAAEPAFAKVLGANHHEVTRWIVCAEGPISYPRSLRPLLEARGVDPAEVWSIVHGDSKYSALLCGAINLDTLDGITRVARDFRIRSLKIPDKIFEWKTGTIAIDSAAIEVMDRFWALKDRIYDRVINLPSNILAETRLCEMVQNSVTKDVLARLERFDDKHLLHHLEQRYGDVGLREGEDEDYELRPHVAWGQVLVRMRKRYFVAEENRSEGALGLSQWKNRYRHVREAAYLVSKRQQLDLPHTSTFLTLDDPEI